MHAKSAPKEEHVAAAAAKRDVVDRGRRTEGVAIKTSAPVDVGPGEEAVTIRAKRKDDEGRKVAAVVKATRRPDTLHYIERKLVEKGIQRLERHPADGLSLGHPPPKSGHGGKYTWEGPDDEAESELNPAPPAIDPKVPNYVAVGEEEEPTLEDEAEGDRKQVVIGEVEVAKVAELVKEGVSRIEVVEPRLQPIAGGASP